MAKKGLYEKYHIEKVDGTPLDPEAEYFILRLDTDSAARAAAWTYASVIRDKDPELASQLQSRVIELMMLAKENE